MKYIKIITKLSIKFAITSIFYSALSSDGRILTLLSRSTTGNIAQTQNAYDAMRNRYQDENLPMGQGIANDFDISILNISNDTTHEDSASDISDLSDIFDANDDYIDMQKLMTMLGDGDAIIDAIMNNNYNLVARLITINRNHRDDLINYQDANGITLLVWAITCNNINIVELLLYHGVNINTLDTDDYTPLECAILHNNCDIARVLFNENARFDKNKIIEQSVNFSSDMIELLLQYIERI